MHTIPSTASGRALVLGGGGSAGNAWVIGVLAGLLDAGLDVTGAALIVGTSAGATAAAQVTAVSPARLLADIVAAPVARRAGQVAARGAGGGGIDPMARTNWIIAASRDLPDLRRRLGAAALELDAGSDAAAQSRWRDVVAARLPGTRWPDQRLLITAVDARTGEPVVFDRASGVDLVDAVAASTSSGAPYRIGDARYIDGGYRRSSENADLAAGSERVLVLSPLGGRTRLPIEWGAQLAVQVEELRASGSRVETVLLDADALRAFGTDMMDPAARPPAAQAGFAQGSALADSIAGVWGA